MSASLIDLPPELLYHIGESCPHQALCSLRLVSRNLQAVTTPLCFREISFSPDEDPLDADSEEYVDAEEGNELPGWFRIAQHEALRHHVRHAVVRFPSEVYFPWSRDALRLRFPKDRPTLIDHFPSLNSVSLRLWSDGRPAEQADDLYALIGRITGAQRGVRGRKEASSLNLMLDCVRPEHTGMGKLLAVRGGSDSSDARVADPAVPTTSDQTVSYTSSGERELQKLERLHLGLSAVSERNIPRSWGMTGFTEPWLHEWSKQVQARWLQPQAETLTHLSLYRATYWTFDHRHDLSSTHFPNLRALALGNYCLSWRNQLASILSLKTLQSLLLDDCPIVFLKCLEAQPWSEADPSGDEDWHYLKSHPHSECSFSLSKAHWSSYFDQIATDLPQLRRFGFRPGNWNPSNYPSGRSWQEAVRTPLEQNDVFGIDFHRSSRYVAFDGRLNTFMEILTQDKPDEFFRVDLDKELNYRMRKIFGKMLVDEVPGITEERSKADLEGLNRLLTAVHTRNGTRT